MTDDEYHNIINSARKRCGKRRIDQKPEESEISVIMGPGDGPCLALLSQQVSDESNDGATQSRNLTIAFQAIQLRRCLLAVLRSMAGLLVCRLRPKHTRKLY